MLKPILEVIAENAKTYEKVLDLGAYELSEVPAQIGKLKWLSELTLGGAADRPIASAPSDRDCARVAQALSGLTNLEKLRIGGRPRRQCQFRDLSAVAGLANLQEIDVSFSRVQDLTPIAALTGLKTLNVSGTAVSSLGPIGALSQLQSLRAWATDVSDLTPVHQLRALQHLDVQDTLISDLEPLAYLTALQTLRIGNTSVANLGPLARLVTLTSLDLPRTFVSDLSALVSLSDLQSLDAHDIRAACFEPLARLQKLQKLNLSDTDIDDLSVIAGLLQLQSLKLSNARVRNLSGLDNLAELTELDVSDTRVSNLQPIASLKKLQKLDVSRTDVAALDGLRGMSGLEELDLSYTTIRDVAPLRALRALRTLDVSNTRTADLAVLKFLPRLETLLLSSTAVKDFTQVASVTTLQSLTLIGGSPGDLRPLSSLQDLRRLALMGQDIVSLRPLAKLSNLESIFMPGSQVTELGALAGLSKLRYLNLSESLVTHIAELGELVNLERLILSGTRVSDLSPLTTLQGLRELNISNTGVIDIAPVAQLPSLQSLDASFTKVCNLSPLSRSFCLETLRISHAHVRDLSPIARLWKIDGLAAGGSLIDDIGPVAELKNLTYLDINKTPVSNFAPLERLRRLSWLRAGETRLADLGKLKGLSRLQQLHVSGTPVTDLAPVACLARLATLEIDGTAVADLAPLSGLTRLELLNVSNTRTTDLSTVQHVLENAYRRERSADYWKRDYVGLTAKNCPLVNPPAEVAHGGSAAILNYFLEKRRQGVDHLHEAKVLLIGEGGAGKTSLLRRLYLPKLPLPREDESTRGITIHSQTVQRAGVHPFRLNVWDFAGQEIYHATHQFFLTRRSVYVLVDDTRKDYRSLQDEGLRYWLDLVEVFGEGSPVLIFQNEKGGRSKRIDLSGIQQRFGNVLQLHAGDLQDPKAADELRKAIELAVRKLPHFGEELPAGWVKVRAEIETRARHTAHMSQQQYFDIYARHLPFDREKAALLSRYLHDLGVFLHFQDDPLLKHIVILQNTFATEAVFKMLDDEQVKRRFGRFTAADCERVWQGSAYAGMHPELLALMLKFELCYLLADCRPAVWLMPQMLSASRPAEAPAMRGPQDLVLRYRYEFLPKGMIGRLMVRQHRFVRRPGWAWLTGAVFEHEDSQVLVELLETRGEIELRARGPERKELLSVIAAALDALNETFGGLRGRIDRWIPCSCRSCHAADVPEFYSHKRLLQRKIDNRLAVECPSSYEHVGVLQLLDGVQVHNLPAWSTGVDSSALASTAVQPTRTLRIFLASSSELRSDRDEFDLYFRQQNDHLRRDGVYLEIVRWEKFLDAMSSTRSQDGYNQAVRECDIFVGLFFTKVGQFTQEEFGVALEQFKRTGKPKIFTFLKNAPRNVGDIGEEFVSLLQWRKTLSELGHFFTAYDSIEHLKLLFRDQLQLLLHPREVA